MRAEASARGKAAAVNLKRGKQLPSPDFTTVVKSGEKENSSNISDSYEETFSANSEIEEEEEKTSKTQDKIANIVGLSRESLRRIGIIKDLADQDPDTYGNFMTDLDKPDASIKSIYDRTK